MRSTTTQRRAGALIGLAIAVALVAGACSSDNTTTSSTGTTGGTTATTAGGVTTSGAPGSTIPKADVLKMQQELDAVGCDVGPNDGILGPETLGALVAFQKAAKLTPDGNFGPETKAALTAASKSGKKECVPPPTTTSTTHSSGTSPTPSVTTSGSAACTSAAITAGLKNAGTNLVNLDGFGCASGYAYAYATVSSGPPGTVVPPGGVGVTLVLQAQGSNWVQADRVALCAKGNTVVPAAIYAQACQTN